jgi:integrase
MSLKLLKRGKVYHLRGTVAGQLVRETTGTADRAQAEDYRDKRAAEIWQRRQIGEASVVTFDEAAAGYLTDRDPGNNDRRRIARLLGFFCPGYDAPRAAASRFAVCSKIGQTDVDRAVSAIVGTTAAPSTKVREVITPLTAILTYAARRGWCARPMFDRPRQPKGKTRWLTPEEAQALILAAAPHLKPLLVFLLGTGARLSEALDLDWTDVDLAAGRAMFRHTKNGHDRPAGLPSAVIAALSALPYRDGRVFRRDDGQPYVDRHREEGGQIKTAFKGACRRAGIENLTPHDLRHTWASWLYAVTKDPMRVMVEGGWRQLSMVQRYAHLAPSGIVSQIKDVWGAHHPAAGQLPGTKSAQDEAVTA